jgi:hypothetical protein
VPAILDRADFSCFAAEAVPPSEEVLVQVLLHRLEDVALAAVRAASPIPTPSAAA